MIHIRFQKAQLGIKMETFPDIKHPGCSSKARKIYLCHISGSDYEPRITETLYSYTGTLSSKRIDGHNW